MENMNQNTSGTAPEQQQEKTFTQEQLNAIVGKRLAEQKQQHEAELVKRETELNKREMSIKAKELLAEKKLPKELADVLKYDNEAELKKAIETIENARGFSKGNEMKVEGYKLPTGTHEPLADPIADAFKMKG